MCFLLIVPQDLYRCTFACTFAATAYHVYINIVAQFMSDHDTE